MTVKQVAIRLKPEGGSETVRMFRDAEQAGVRAQDSTTAAADKASAALDRQAERWRRTAQASREAHAAAQSNAAWDRALVQGGTRLDTNAMVSARSSAEVFEAQFRAMDQQAEAAARLKAAIDPLGAAQDRYNAELAEARGLHRAGALSARELAQAEQLLKSRLDATTASMNARTGGMTRMERASRLNLARQGADVLTTAAMGMNPGMIAIQQGPQIMDAWATSGIKANAAMVALFGSVGLVAAGVGVMGAAWLDAEGRMTAADRAAEGLGRTAGLTGEGLRELAREAADSGDISIREADRLAVAYVSTGRLGSETISELIEHHRDLSNFLGLEGEEAQRALAAAMMDPVKAAEDMTREFGLLDQETIDLIESLMDQGDQLGANRVLLDELSGAAEGHAEKVGQIESAWDAAARSISDAVSNLGTWLYMTEGERVQNAMAGLERQIQSRENRIAAIEGGNWFEATLEGGISGLSAMSPEGRAREAARLRRENQTDRLSLFEIEFEQFVEGAAARADAARARANQEAQLAEDRQDRSNRRVGGSAGAAGSASSADREARLALRREREVEDQAHALRVEIARLDANEDLLRKLEDQERVRERMRGLMDAGMQVDEARATANQELAQVDEARERAMSRFLESESDALQLQRARMLGDHATARLLEDRVAREERIVELQRQGLSLAKARIIADQEFALFAHDRELMMRIARDRDDLGSAMAIARARGDRQAMHELREDEWVYSRARELESLLELDFGQGDEQAAAEWGALVAAETEGAFRHGAHTLIDALDDGGLEGVLDRIFDRTTDRLADDLADILGSFLHEMSQNGSGISGWLGRAAGWLFDIPGNARGTDYFDGGWTWVGEEGPELIRAPRGSKIRDHGRSLAMARQAAGPVNGVIDVRVRVAPSPLLETEVDTRANNAALRVMSEAREPILREAAAQAGPSAVDFMRRERIMDGG